MNAIKILSMGVLVANCLKIMNGGKGAENKNAVEGAGGGREACVVISCFSCYPSSFQRSCGGFFCFSVLPCSCSHIRGSLSRRRRQNKARISKARVGIVSLFPFLHKSVNY